MGVVTFYSYYLMSLVLDHCEKAGRRHIRFRELAADVLGTSSCINALFLIFIEVAMFCHYFITRVIDVFDFALFTSMKENGLVTYSGATWTVIGLN